MNHLPAPSRKSSLADPSSLRMLVIGSINIDLVAEAERIPKPGETVMGSGFHRHFGGKGANQAVAAAKAGAQVRLLGAVGSDDFGLSALKHLSDAGVDTSECGTETGASTGVALIAIDAGAENSIIIVPGANGLVSPERLAGVRWQDFDAVLLQFEIPLETVWEAIRKASLHTRVIVTPAPAAQIPPELLPCIDVIIPNQHEVSLLGHPGGEASHTAARLARQVRGGVALTLGSAGAKWFGCGGDVLEIKAPVVAAIDTVGAGDCFTGYFACAYAGGLTVEAALRRACAAAAIQVTRTGAQSAMPGAGEVNAFLE